jgi:DNA polymerase-3 subunit delta'
MSEFDPVFKQDVLMPWLQEDWQQLMQRHSQHGLPHASLFTGSEGYGKRQLAYKLAFFLLCQDENKVDRPCGQCHSCQLMKAGTHPDYWVCNQEAKGKQIKVDAIRSLNDFLSKTPQIAACQVVQIFPVEAMNVNASNALLKTLEEPSGESYLLLISERLGSVLPTIRSRTQRVSIQAPESQIGLQWLSQQHGIDHEQARQALSQNAGGPLKALQWLNDGQAEQDAQCADLMKAWLEKQDLQKVSAQLGKMGLDNLLNWWLRLSLDILKCGMTGGVEHVQHADKGWVQQLTATASKLKLLTLQSKLQEIISRLAVGQGNYNQSLLIESLLLDWKSALSTSQN